MAGLSKACTDSNLMGRFEMLSKECVVIKDNCQDYAFQDVSWMVSELFDGLSRSSSSIPCSLTDRDFDYETDYIPGHRNFGVYIKDRHTQKDDNDDEIDTFFDVNTERRKLYSDLSIGRRKERVLSKNISSKTVQTNISNQRSVSANFDAKDKETSDVAEEITLVRNTASEVVYSRYDEILERLFNDGVSSLNKSELLSLIIASDSEKNDTIDLCDKILDDCDGMYSVLARKSVDYLRSRHGMGVKKAASIVAAMAIANKRDQEKFVRDKKISLSTDIYQYLLPLMRDLDHEEFKAVYLNTNNEIIKVATVAKGGFQSCSVDIRVVIKEAVMCGAISMVAAHNHPLGLPKPSVQDESLTRSLQSACKLVSIPLIDHIILSRDGYYSFKDYNNIL